MNRCEDLKAKIQQLKDSVELFSNKGRRERELWVCKRLVDALGVTSLGTLRAEENDPPDCIFSGTTFEVPARFEVKELQDMGRKRHDEFREALKDAQAEYAQNCSGQPCPQSENEVPATLIDDNSLHSRTRLVPYETVGLNELINDVASVAERNLQGMDRALVSTLDLVVYHNRHIWIGDVRRVTAIPSLTGWRSVTMVENELVMVISAQPSAPKFLYDAQGHVFQFPQAR